MTVYIGNAVGNELGTASGGEPGNQTGKELRIQPWYLNKKGWRVFRPKSAEIAEKLVYDMRAACDNMNIGYSQEKRNTLYTAAKPYAFDCSLVVTPCECDCSSLVRVCIWYAGIKIPNFNTVSEPKRLLETGEFEEMEGEEYTDSPNKLKAGDILVTKTKGHTALVLNDGPDVDPDPPTPPDPPVPPEPPVEDKTVVVVAKSVFVRKGDGILSRIMFTAHRGNHFKLIDIAESGWYHIETYKGEGYITNKEKYTKLVET